MSVREDVCRLYDTYKTPERVLVAHKGGVEGIWLANWKIPHLNLEDFGCPKFDRLPRLTSVGTCGQHARPMELHCPQVECYHFVQWMRSQRALTHDTNYIHYERTMRFLAYQKPQMLSLKQHMSNYK